MAKKRTNASEPRRPLNREQVLRAAVGLVDEAGLDALTMRRLGERLGVEAMSLYNHVTNKEDIVDGIAETVLLEIELPADAGDWRSAMRRRAVSVREVLSRHPWATNLIGNTAHPGEATLRYADWVLGCLMKAGFSADLAMRAFWIIDSYIFGFINQQASLGPESDEAGEHTRAQSADDYPYLIEASTTYAAGPGWDFDKEFIFGLDLILEALERRRVDG